MNTKKPVERKSKREIVEALMERTHTILYVLPAQEVASNLAVLMSIDPQLLNSVATIYVQRLTKVANKTLEETLGEMFADLFKFPMHLEIRTEQITSGSFDGSVYLFGMDQPFYSIPMKLFRSSTSAFACLSRLTNEPGQMPEGCSFRKTMCEADNSEMRYSQFAYNATFNAIFSRFSLLVALCVSLSATSRVQEAKFVDNNDHSMMRVLVHGALMRLVENISRPEVRANKPHLTDALIVKIHQLIKMCSALETFHSLNLMQLSVENYRTVCQTHSMRIAVN
jgi:hypothetical protein